MKAMCIGREDIFHSLMDEKACYDMLRKNRWPNGIVHCPYCGQKGVTGPWAVPWERACYRYHCYSCGKQFNDRTGTIFEGSKLPLSAWFLAMYLVELGKTIFQIAREIPCNYVTAFRIVWTIRNREIKLEQGRRLSGIIEADEIYQTAGHKDGRPKEDPIALNRPTRRRGKKKGPGRGSAQKDSPAIEGMVSRDSQVVVEVVDDVKRETLQPVFEKRVEKGSSVYTDTASCYSFLEEAGYHHETVNHSHKEYVRGDVHENRAENLWLFWLTFILPFKGVAKGYLSDYAKVFQFQRNHRDLTAFERAIFVLNSLLQGILRYIENWISVFEDHFILALYSTRMLYSDG
jgi:transposase-like protein